MEALNKIVIAQLSSLGPYDKIFDWLSKDRVESVLLEAKSQTD